MAQKVLVVLMELMNVPRINQRLVLIIKHRWKNIHHKQVGLILIFFYQGIIHVFSFLDFSKGFGGKYGTDQNAQDKSAVGFAHREVVEKHPSQKGNLAVIV